MRLSSTAYRLLLLAFPADIRREFGDDMAQMFAMQMRDARSRRSGIVRLWMRAIADALVNGGGERFKPGDRWRTTREEAARWRFYMYAFQQDIR